MLAGIYFYTVLTSTYSTGQGALATTTTTIVATPCARCLPPGYRRHLSKILSVFSRRLRFRRYTRLSTAGPNGIHLHVEEASENETACTILVPTDCSDGRPSDTEELLGRQEYCTGNEKEVSEDTHKSDTHKGPQTERRQLNFEEFECDVSVEGGLDQKGQERQEFSFTLYDFDGHGKITKDDIAGLVTTIYDTLGSTIKVPHYGSKTIKVKLTVSPDPRNKAGKEESAGATVNEKCNNNCSAGTSPHQNNTPLKVKFKRDLNVTIRESRTPRRPHRRRRMPNKVQEKYANSCSSSCRSGGSENNEECAADISENEEDDEDDEDDDLVAERISGKEFASHPKGGRDNGNRRRYRHHFASVSAQQRNKKRSSSLQREELLQIIQANMEKNNLSFQTSRKPCGDRGGLGHHRHRHKTQFDDSMAARVQLHYLAGDYVNPRNNCYTDFLGHDPYKNHQRCHYDHDCHYDKLLGAVMCGSAQHASNGFHHWGQGHHRSRSHDLGRYHLLEADLAGQRHSYADGVPSSPYQPSPRTRSKSNEADRKFPPSALGHTSSPHHLKHRNREEDQARAMAQVVRWLEQEFSSNLNTSEPLPAKPPPATPKNESSTGPGLGTEPEPDPTSSRKDQPPNSPGASSVEKHEHHHVHKHIHHHYHHYQPDDIPPVLV